MTFYLCLVNINCRFTLTLPSVVGFILGVVKVVVESDVRKGGGHHELALALLDVVEHLRHKEHYKGSSDPDPLRSRIDLENIWLK